MEIAIVGAGWYGCHLALALKQQGHDVSLYEKNLTILSKTSGLFGIRLHAGPHYPRSEETRKNCARGLEEFKIRYPELVIPHEFSFYGLGTTDADDNPPKISQQDFTRVCNESKSAKIFTPGFLGYRNLTIGATIDEPSIALGSRLRTAFTRYLNQAAIKVYCDMNIEQLIPYAHGVVIQNGMFTKRFDKVINATSYSFFIPSEKNFPFDMEVVYQPCIALEYLDKKPLSKPFSFIVIDGWFPCIMPVCDESLNQKYILTHGKWTIMGSFNRVSMAQALLNKLDDNWIVNNIKPFCEYEINRFWPAFAERFEYLGWKGSVLAKLKTKNEFRSALTYEKNNVIHIFPGKVSNIFDVEREVSSLLNKCNILNKNGYFYIKGGILHQSVAEISERPNPGEPNTCTLQTFDELVEASLSFEEGETIVEPQPSKRKRYRYLSFLKEMAIERNYSASIIRSIASP